MGGEKEKALFEAGIKLGAAFHQFIGIPISPENVDIVEKAMESCIRLQPYVMEATVHLDREKLTRNLSEFGYTTLTQELFDVEVKVKVGDTEVSAVLEWDEQLRYPLMKTKDD